MAPTSASLASLPEFDAFTGTTNLSGTATPLLEAASALVRTYAGWHIAPVLTAQTMTVDGSGGTVQLLPTMRLTAVTSVSETTTGAAVLLSALADEYEWSEAGYLLKRGWTWTTRLRGVTAVVNHGYALVPDVAHVVMMMAARAAAGVPMAGVTQETTGPFSVTYGADGVSLAAHELRALARYRLPLAPG
jgi:hypothetical protein